MASSNRRSANKQRLERNACRSFRLHDRSPFKHDSITTPISTKNAFS